MLFNFELFALEDIQPWSSPSRGDEKHLHWFGLTLGRYWIDTGAGELFRYSDDIMAHWARLSPEMDPSPYVDYQVSRLWEDVLQMLPEALEAVPDDLAANLRPGGAWENWAAWERWSDRAHEWMETPEGEANWERFYAASGWWGERKLDSGHLTQSPRQWFWREGDRIHIQWDSRDRLIDGIPTWSSQSGRVSLSVSDFLGEVQSFNDRLIRQMAERVQSIQRRWSRPDIHIDLPGLLKDHQGRATMLGDILAQPPHRTDWGAARAALAETERHLAGMTPRDSTG